ncbi:hypothetical protein E2C01_025302 [Portunus trituberculatus]|uniref:Uncharacterized protein n=1 Tax=Portunus trituberculatus TaxID=210409 RepID=A0A5B7ECL3_PORTR|nr:hypothetical protein [Portunus trituberculatus]
MSVGELVSVASSSSSPHHRAPTPSPRSVFGDFTGWFNFSTDESDFPNGFPPRSTEGKSVELQFPCERRGTGPPRAGHALGQLTVPGYAHTITTPL